MGVGARDSLVPALITYSDVKRLISQAIYAPIQLFPLLANVLSDLDRQNGTAFARLKQSSRSVHLPTKRCQHAEPYSQECIIPDNRVREVPTAILCTGGNGTYGMTKEAFAAYARELREHSWLMGDTWAQIRL